MANTKITSNVISDDIALGGNPTTTTQSAGNDTTRIATTAFVKAAIDATIDSAPGALDTLNELAAAIGDDANFSTTITNSIATKAALAGAAFTGGVSITSGNGDQLLLNNAGERFTQITLQENGTTRGALWVDGTDNFVDLYANTSHGIRLKTGGDNTRVTVKDDGKVGIGTNNIDAKLHIEGNSDTSDEDCMLVVEDLDTTAGSQVPAILFKGNGSTIGRMRVNDSLGFMFSGGSTMSDDLVVKNGPLVGIGTDSPGGSLHIHKTGGNNTVLLTNNTNTAGTYTDLKWAHATSGEYGSGLRFKQVDTSHGGQLEFWTDNASGTYTQRMVLGETGLLSFEGSANTEGIKLGTNNRIYGAGGARAIEASSTTLQIGEGYSSTNGVMIGSTGSAHFKRKGSNEGSIFFQQGGIGATTHTDTYPTMLMSAAYDNTSIEGLKFWVLCSASEWRPCVIHAIGASTVNTLTGQTAGWATIRCTHHAGSISAAVMDSGGGGTFAVNDLGGGSGNSDIEMQVTYSAGSNNRTVISAWCANYGTISGVVRA